MPAPEVFDAVLTASRYLAPNVRELVFERADGKPMEFSPGQWVNLLLSLPAGDVKRAYSIASPPDGTPRFELAVTRVVGGPGSEHLHAIPEGTIVRAVGPQGFFTRGESELAPALFVATGTGVTPLRSMIKAALRASSRAPARRGLGPLAAPSLVRAPARRGLGPLAAPSLVRAGHPASTGSSSRAWASPSRTPTA